MKSRYRLKRGGGLVEILVAGVILSVSLAAIVSMFAFGFNMTQRSDNKSVAYNAARWELERIRVEGFGNYIITRDGSGNVTSRGLDGTETVYYDNAGSRLTSASGASYSVTIVITSDKVDVLNNGTQRPAADALRTVIATVRRLSDNTVVHTDGTMLVRSGV